MVQELEDRDQWMIGRNLISSNQALQTR